LLKTQWGRESRHVGVSCFLHFLETPISDEPTFCNGCISLQELAVALSVSKRFSAGKYRIFRGMSDATKKLHSFHGSE
jgi:hypothetical protein